ncbi:MAG: D-alanine--D-alanine ligase [candidate division Zixibacteria bacterium]|nr:D-alanine--D-alanine ligase [candidate division Zixibacteria bacterium]
MTPKHVLVLSGGDSHEREISLASARAVTKGLHRLGHQTSVFDITTCKSLLDESGEFLPNVEIAPSINQPEDTFLNELFGQLRAAPELSGADVVFLALHGGSGENGEIQDFLDDCDKKYTGSDARASHTAMNKASTKREAMTLGIRTPEWVEITEEVSAHPDLSSEVESTLGLPVVVKPSEGGSTQGLTVVRELARFPGALILAREYCSKIIAEQYIPGREITVSVFDGAPWPALEIVPKSGLYDYHSKYTPGATQYICPAEITEELAGRMRSDAVSIYKELNCRGLARVDFILDQSQTPQFLELNTIPGLTELSLSPMAARAVGIEFDQLLEMIISSALKL